MARGATQSVTPDSVVYQFAENVKTFDDVNALMREAKRLRPSRGFLNRSLPDTIMTLDQLVKTIQDMAPDAEDVARVDPELWRYIAVWHITRNINVFGALSSFCFRAAR